jgi:UPF0716 protein FxsA
MSAVGRLAFLLVVVPILEIVILVRLGQLIGLWPTVALVLGAGVAGAALARLEGTRVLFAFRQELASGRLPAQALLDGVSVAIGAALLLAPGVLTDVAGLALLFPPSRRWIQRQVRRRLERAVAEGQIRVSTLGADTPGAWGAGRAHGAWRGSAERGSTHGLDPSKGIVIESDDP